MIDEKDKQQEDNTSTEASIKAGKEAIDIAKKTAPTEDEKTEESQKDDAKKWRNEGWLLKEFNNH